MSATYLGIDMGGTASRWALVDARGAPVARGTAPGATGHLFNPAARSEFETAIAAIAAEGFSAPARVYLGATGLGPRATADAHAILAAQLGIAPDVIASSDDMELAFRAAFAPGAGHLVAAGTGSIGLHITGDGDVVRVGGRGILIDDAGSGAWITLTAFDRLYRLIDETGAPGEADSLAACLFEAVGGADWDSVRAFVYGADRGRIGALAQEVARAAEAGDSLAQTILGEAGTQLARLGQALVSRCGDRPIGYVGGVIGLSPIITDALAKALPGHALVYPTIDAALAAAGLARQQAREP